MFPTALTHVHHDASSVMSTATMHADRLLVKSTSSKFFVEFYRMQTQLSCIYFVAIAITEPEFGLELPDASGKVLVP